MGLTGKKKTHRANIGIDLDVVDAQPEEPSTNPQGLLRNFVSLAGVPKWGSAFGANGTYSDLKSLRKPGVGDSFTPNEEGLHTVVLVFFEQGPDGRWRFRQVQTEEIQVVP